MTTPLTLDVDRREDGALVLLATGEIDLSNVKIFARAVDAAIAERGDGATVTVDLSAVDYLDSGGINVLFTFADHIRLIVKPLLIPVLTISGLTKLAVVESAPSSDR
jgi:anti-anti-sigma factor